MKEVIKPIEKVDPVFAALVNGIANGQAPYGINAMSIDNKVATFLFTDGRIEVQRFEVGRNDKCPFCLEQGLSVKWKRCWTHNEELT